jgi:Family of unknown function (DUF6272)
MPFDKISDLKTVYELHKAMEDNQVIIAYEGEFNSNITQSVLSLAEKNLDQKLDKGQTKRRAFNIAVECLQNISTHSDRNEEFPNSIFIIGQEGNEFYISSGNTIKASKVENLQRKLDQINNLDREGLKQLHMQAIKESMKRQESNNAGLGLISIARKSGKKLDYQFVPVDQDNSFFSFQASFIKQEESL